MAIRNSRRAVQTSWRADRKALAWINLACGLVLFISPWFLGFSRDFGAAITAWAGGFIIFVMGLSALVQFAEWEDYVALLAGAMMIVLPWELGFAIQSEIWAFTALGAIAVLVSLLEIWMAHRHPAAAADG